MRKLRFAEGEYYHLYNRGNNKQLIFRDKRDRVRFLFLVLHMQSKTEVRNIILSVSRYLKSGNFGLRPETIEKIVSNRYIELVSFCLMPNHFHLVIKENVEGGISKYMHRVSLGYSKYLNEKYDQIAGHVFQGTYKAVHIRDNTQLLNTSAYIHRNPRDVRGWRGNELDYPWSSYQDYVKDNRWGELLRAPIVTNQFNSGKEYRKYVQSGLAKENQISFQ